MRTKTFIAQPYSAAAALVGPSSAQAQLFLTGASQCNTMVRPNSDLTPFWDGASTDGTYCNIGFYPLMIWSCRVRPCRNHRRGRDVPGSAKCVNALLCTEL